MTGPEHYVAAERLIDQARLDTTAPATAAAYVARAQVHATLALAAATAMHGVSVSDAGWARDWRYLLAGRGVQVSRDDG